MDHLFEQEKKDACVSHVSAHQNVFLPERKFNHSLVTISLFFHACLLLPNGQVLCPGWRFHMGQHPILYFSRLTWLWPPPGAESAAAKNADGLTQRQSPVYSFTYLMSVDYITPTPYKVYHFDLTEINMSYSYAFTFSEHNVSAKIIIFKLTEHLIHHLLYTILSLIKELQHKNVQIWVPALNYIWQQPEVSGSKNNGITLWRCYYSLSWVVTGARVRFPTSVYMF